MKKTIKLLTIPALLATTLGMVGCNKNENSSSTSSSSNTSATTSSSPSKNNLENADLILYFIDSMKIIAMSVHGFGEMVLMEGE